MKFRFLLVIFMATFSVTNAFGKRPGAFNSEPGNRPDAMIEPRKQLPESGGESGSRIRAGTFGRVGEPDTLSVRHQRGYAILVQGALHPYEDAEGADEHEQTLRYVKNVLHADGRGMARDNIYEVYAQKGETKMNLTMVIEEVREKLKKKPAPLYVVLVGHGEEDRFPMGSVDLTSLELQEGLARLQEALRAGHRTRRVKKIIVVLGMCYSGSFIDELWAPGRIIISSSRSTERSIRGPGDSDSRHGDYFVAHLFKGLSEGKSLLNSFIASRDIIGEMTRGIDLTGNGSTRSSWACGQHPLLEGDGEGSGSYRVSDVTGDGRIAVGVFIRSSETPFQEGAIATKNPTQFLSNPEDEPVIWVEVPKADWIEEVSVAVKKVEEDGVISPNSTSMQFELDIESSLVMEQTDSTGDLIRFEWRGLEAGSDLFNKPGKYELLYCAKIKDSPAPVLLGLTRVFRNFEGALLNSFNLVSPESGTAVTFNLDRGEDGDVDESSSGLFRWEETDAPNHSEIRYIFRLWDNENGENQENLENFILERGPLETNFVFLRLTSFQAPTVKNSSGMFLQWTQRETPPPVKT